MRLACTPILACRCCGSGDLSGVFDLGMMPPSDALSASAADPDPAYPLEVVMCRGCGLAQLRHTVMPEVLFAEGYRYFSSYTRTVVENARESVTTAIARFRPAPGALAIELASNDGYLLKQAAAQGLSTLGIDTGPGPGSRGARGRYRNHPGLLRRGAGGAAADGGAAGGTGLRQ
jgi:hypothetical protein